MAKQLNSTNDSVKVEVLHIKHQIALNESFTYNNKYHRQHK